MNILRADHLVKTFRSRKVVDQVSISVKSGEVIGLLGPNGAGKTTSFYMTVGLIPVDKGNIFLNEKNITRLPMHNRARLGIGYLPQEASIFRKLSVTDNIMAILETRDDLSRGQRKQRLQELLDDLQIDHIRDNTGISLSGGERRRAEIARALAAEPRFILLDEPFAGVDPIAVEDIQKIVKQLKERNIGVLITDHNVHETLNITDHSYLLFEGKILKQGTSEYLANDQEARRLYLGEKFKLMRDN